ncbi:MAG TPA: helicase-related protein [Stellaceae bacterium]|nr:helicase-related protein [Stellaceae bacterium]
MTNTPTSSDTAPRALPRSIDLDAVERSGIDLTEAKEAVVEGVLRHAIEQCTGEGTVGELVFGVKPSAKFVSGFLLPRFDASGQEDETSDIHIATMGIDMQVAAEQSGEIVVIPEFSIYVRLLPTWEELTDRRHDMMPRSELSRETRQEVENRARQYINEALASLKPLDELIEADERPGDALAEAERARDTADQADLTAAEQGDAESRGHNRAAQEAAQRLERVAAARQNTVQQRVTARRERNAAVAAIRREAFSRAFAELGVSLRDSRAGAGAERPIRADDLESDIGSEDTQPDIPAPLAEAEQRDEQTGPPSDGEPAAVAAGTVIVLRPDAGILDDRIAGRQAIPMKWRRFRLDLGEFRFDCHDEASRVAASDMFAVRVLEQARAILGAWISSPEGQRDAYRPNERILPSQFATKANWERYLDQLRTRRPAVLKDILPDLTDVQLVLDAAPDFIDPARVNLRASIENGAQLPSRQTFQDFEPSLFQVSLQLTLPIALHRPLKLDRVQPSYRFKDWLEYPAMGLNCGVEPLPAHKENVRIGTTWAPRYVQPRTDPVAIDGLPTRYVELQDPNCDITRLLLLPERYDAWITAQARGDAGSGLPADSADRERQAHAQDIEGYRRESHYVRTGIQLLLDSRNAARDVISRAPLGSWSAIDPRAAPLEAWLLTNETFAYYGGTRFTDWRLFQLAFILAHVPTLASRMPEYADRFEADRDELTASLLYFATGGGKSEAFFGLLVFNLFLDRLRGKQRGITALVRYPLRLLTLQQARRLMRILAKAELIRLRRRIPGAPFEIGFWVGSGNTPNRVAQGFGGVPAITLAAYANDTNLLNPPQGDTEADRAARRRSESYKETLESYDKLRTCPCCGKPTGMRRYPSQDRRIGIVCFNDACEWNRENPPAPLRVPLPFLLTDDTIYQRAPAVILGTIDKLALIGQHDRTINHIVGMFGAARFMSPDNRHFQVPRGPRALARAADEGWTRLRPAYSDGAALFHDPFPSLVIQDEGHLLEESLGTFSGLFETAFEGILERLGTGLLRDCVATWRPDPQSDERKPRMAKIIAATATISDPDRQLRVLYQREPLRFPCPGPNIYESFYAMPRVPRNAERRRLAGFAPAQFRSERFAPRMRTYVSIMTNGRSHTMTTSAVVSAYHLVITRLWRMLVEEGRVEDATRELAGALDPDDPLTPLRRGALESLATRGDGPSILAALLDLQRISLTYVTNKKGGDQIIETLQTQVERDQRAEGIGDLAFETELISGGVTIAEIQEVMARAEGSIAPGQAFPPLGESLRNIVATSAISHGVDVDKFNAMFFAGLPSDIAEYIQASSRVGRTHVGFSLLVPTPHARRDRYVVETHDQFHRFLERMIPPPAVQRWAERAIRRAMPSFIQAYLCGVVEQELFAVAVPNKNDARTFSTAAAIKTWADRHTGGNPGAIRDVTEFALEAIGLEGRGSRQTGAATHADHYRKFVEDRVRDILGLVTQRSDSSKLSNFWQSHETRDMRKPMLSLRDVDTGGIIQGATRDPWRGKNVHLETTRQVMRVIRGQRIGARADVDDDPPPIDVED